MSGEVRFGIQWRVGNCLLCVQWTRERASGRAGGRAVGWSCEWARDVSDRSRAHSHHQADTTTSFGNLCRNHARSFVYLLCAGVTLIEIQYLYTFSVLMSDANLAFRCALILKLTFSWRFVIIKFFGAVHPECLACTSKSFENFAYHFVLHSFFFFLSAQ